MVLPTSTWAPEVPAVIVGDVVPPPSEPQPARAMTGTASRTPRRAQCIRCLPGSSIRLGGRAVEPVGHTELTAAVDQRGFARFEQRRLIESVDGDVVDDV